MNNWQNNSQTSPGFVYFANNVTPPQNKAETSDFLAFDAQPSPKSSKSNTNSPNRYQRGNHRGQFRAHQYAGNNQSPSPNNSKYNNQWNRNKQNFNKGNNSFNKNRFLHPSFMEDPWLELEKLSNNKSNEIDASESN